MGLIKGGVTTQFFMYAAPIVAFLLCVTLYLYNEARWRYVTNALSSLKIGNTKEQAYELVGNPDVRIITNAGIESVILGMPFEVWEYKKYPSIDFAFKLRPKKDEHFISFDASGNIIEVNNPN
jgi:hypothetical protein